MIREFREKDLEAVERIYNASKLDELAYENENFKLLPLKHDEKRYRELLESDVFVFDDGDVIGYTAILGNEIRSLFVDPDHRGRGIGKELMDFILKRTNSEARLFIAKTNHPARYFYGKLGFSVSDEFETSYNGISVLANKMVRGHDS